jgi:predicted nucleic acid-binding protein
VTSDKPKVYVDSAVIIDLVKHKAGVGITTEREQDAWHLQRMLDAARHGKVSVFTSAISVAECTHVEDQNKLEQAKPFFLGLLASGRGGFTLAQPTLSLMERARDLRWLHAISLSGLDAVHAATALQFKCEEIWTRDTKFVKFSSAFSAMGLRVSAPRETSCLPDEYRQQRLGLG